MHKTNAIFIDVGAHIGRYSLILAKMFPNAKIIAVEPDPEGYQALIRGIEANKTKNIIAFNIALSDFDGIANLYRKRGTAISSLVERENSFNMVKVSVKRLDTIVEELKVNEVDIIKIDVEGAELHVVRGALNTITKYKPILIIEIREGNLQNLVSLLTSLNYNCKHLEDMNYMCNALQVG
jgi:FkbM family methyltransferase